MGAGSACFQGLEKLDNPVITGESGDGAVVGGFAGLREKAAGDLVEFAMVGNAFTAVASFTARIGAGAHFQVLLFVRTTSHLYPPFPKTSSSAPTSNIVC